MKNIFELQHLFLARVEQRAPEIVRDLFKHSSALAWANRWGFQCGWLQKLAQSALDRMHVELAVEPAKEIIPEIEMELWHDITPATTRMKPPPLHIDFFGIDEAFCYLSEKELFDRLRNDPRIRQTISEYHKRHFQASIFRDIEKSRQGKEADHAVWLALYIAEMTDAQIADCAGDVDENAVRIGRTRFAKKIKLKLKPRQGRPKKPNSKRRKK